MAKTTIDIKYNIEVIQCDEDAYKLKCTLENGDSVLSKKYTKKEIAKALLPIIEIAHLKEGDEITI